MGGSPKRGGRVAAGCMSRGRVILLAVLGLQLLLVMCLIKAPRLIFSGSSPESDLAEEAAGGSWLWHKFVAESNAKTIRCLDATGREVVKASFVECENHALLRRINATATFRNLTSHESRLPRERRLRRPGGEAARDGSAVGELRQRRTRNGSAAEDNLRRRRKKAAAPVKARERISSQLKGSIGDSLERDSFRFRGQVGYIDRLRGEVKESARITPAAARIRVSTEEELSEDALEDALTEGAEEDELASESDGAIPATSRTSLTRRSNVTSVESLMKDAEEIEDEELEKLTIATAPSALNGTLSTVNATLYDGLAANVSGVNTTLFGPRNVSSSVNETLIELFGTQNVNREANVSSVNGTQFGSLIVSALAINATLGKLFENATLEELFANAALGERFANASLEELFANATLGDLFANATLEERFANATLEELFANATLKGLFANATLGEHFVNATLGELFANATLELFANATLGELFANATLEEGFANATLEEGFANATLEEGFANATLEKLFANATEREQFENATLGELFANATLGEQFVNATLGELFANATLEERFANATLGGLFANATLGDLFENATLGAIFGNATVAELFANATLGELFKNATHGEHFTNAALGEPYANATLEEVVTANVSGINATLGGATAASASGTTNATLAAQFGALNGSQLEKALPGNVSSSINATTLAANVSDVQQNATCAHGLIYVYTLPKKFNTELLENCSSLLQWGDRCRELDNFGLGPSLASSPLNQTQNNSGPWYGTDQFNGEVMFHSRMLAHPCRTQDPERAAAFYIPYYGGLDVARFLFNASHTAATRDRLGAELVAWLARSPYWKRRHGADHFLVLGRITWDFRRKGSHGWGSSLINMAAMANVTKLTLERSPWDETEMAIPYPTAFHPRDEREVAEWQDALRNVTRKNLFAFAGAPRKEFPKDFRGNLFEQCRLAERCEALDCSERRCEDDPFAATRLFTRSTFCLQPRGDSYTRRSIFDALVAGCIPVFFWTRTAYLQYNWHLPPQYAAYSVFIPKADVRAGASIEAALLKISPGKVRQMQEAILAMVPRLVYAGPGHEFEDALDVAVARVMANFDQVRRNGTSVIEQALGPVEDNPKQIVYSKLT